MKSFLIPFTLLLAGTLSQARPAQEHIAVRSPEADPLALASELVEQVDGVKIKSVTYGGTGCPQDTLNVDINADASLMPLYFSRYVAAVGPGASVTDQRKFCQLNIELELPAGFQFSIWRAEYHGYAQLERGVAGSIKSTYYFSGETDQTSSEITFAGPFTGQYTKNDEEFITSWSQCGGTTMLNMKTQLALTTDNANASGVLANDELDGHVTNVLHAQWRRC